MGAMPSIWWILIIAVLAYFVGPMLVTMINGLFARGQ